MPGRGFLDHMVVLYKLFTCGQLNYDKRGKIYNGEKTASSIRGPGKTGQLHVKERNQSIVLHHVQK